MPPAEEFYTYDEVLKELGLSPEELARLVSQGELRGFKVGNMMQFKKADVEALKQGRESEPTIILSDADDDVGSVDLDDALVLDEAGGDDTVLNLDEVMAEDEEVVLADDLEATATVPNLDGEAQEDDELIVALPDLEEEVNEVEGDVGETLVDEPAATESGSDTFELVDEEVVVDETEFEDADAAVTSRRSGRRPGTSSRSLAMVPQKGTILWTIVLSLTTVVLVLPLGVYINLVRGTAPEWVTDMAGNFGWMVDSFYSMFN